uniref:Uncharacterized protein n=1 Tax=Anguilla anguilla TaxID=7936 RepID=A0A0E9X6T2_ANGAN
MKGIMRPIYQSHIVFSIIFRLIFAHHFPLYNILVCDGNLGYFFYQRTKRSCLCSCSHFIHNLRL